jgi:DUF4097 and DUF4098 domain-containing protein YvlB
MPMFTIAALVVATLAGQPAGQERAARPPQTDQTVAVTRGAKLRITNFAGEVILHTWDKDSLRVQARHQSRARVNIRTSEGGVTITSSSTAGPLGSVDYDITAPAWMAVRIEGQFNFTTVDGVQGEVSVETVRGDINIKGGTGTVTAKSIEGQITVEGARGKINVSTVNEGIKISGSSGDIVAETTNGDIALSNIQSSAVEINTVNGSILYDGTTNDKGSYRFATHNGNITIAVPETANITFSIRSYSGSFYNSLSGLKGPPPREVRSGRRATFTLGTGSADVEAESFGGAIRLRVAGTVRLRHP